MGHLSNRSSFPSRSRLWLAAVEGATRPYPREPIHPQDQPETQIEVEFTGISETEQRAALAAFPGGRRFVLKSH